MSRPPLQGLRRWAIDRLDRLLETPLAVQIVLVSLVALLLVTAFAFVDWLVASHHTSFDDAFFWSLTHVSDGGTLASDPPGHRVLATLVTILGIFMLALLTAALTSQMAARIAELRSGLSPLVERDHVLILGYAPNVPLLVRELARSGERLTIAILAAEPKEKIEAMLRSSLTVAGQHLRFRVRTGDPRLELALMRVAADRARSVVVIPPASVSDEDSVRFSLGVLLALRRVMPATWPGKVLVEVRHEEARELLSLASENGIAGPGALATEVFGTDRILADVLAESTETDGLYFVLRHLLAFDGCEIYLDPCPRELLGLSFDDALARIDGAVLIGVLSRGGTLSLCPIATTPPLAEGDRLVVVAEAHGAYRTTGSLPAPSSRPASVPPRAPESITIIGQNATLPHLLENLALRVADGSTLRVLAASELVRRTVEEARVRHPSLRIDQDPRSPVALARIGHDDVCGADAIVVLGEEGDDDANGDASALAMLLRLRKGLRQRGEEHSRIVTEVRDPRSAFHIEPRPGDAVVSSDVVAMLLAQGVLDPDASSVYGELLRPDGACVSLRSVRDYVGEGATFADAIVAARSRGEVALGVYPDPRRHDPSLAATDRRRLEEGDTHLGAEAWLNAPRRLGLSTAPEQQLAILTRRRRRRDVS